jgi:hypothetical protein
MYRRGFHLLSGYVISAAPDNAEAAPEPIHGSIAHGSIARTDHPP